MGETIVVMCDSNVWGFLSCECKECGHEFITSELDISMKKLNYCPSCGHTITLIKDK